MYLASKPTYILRYKLFLILDSDCKYTNDRFAEAIDLDVLDPVTHKHIPYVIILVKMAQEWSNTHGGTLPSTREEKKEFKVYLLGLYIFCYLLLF